MLIDVGNYCLSININFIDRLCDFLILTEKYVYITVGQACRKEGQSIYLLSHWHEHYFIIILLICFVFIFGPSQQNCSSF